MDYWQVVSSKDAKEIMHVNEEVLPLILLSAQKEKERGRKRGRK